MRPDRFVRECASHACFLFDLRESRVRFLESGFQYLHRDKVEEELRRFLDAAVARLEDQGVSGTLLAEEWQAIAGTDSEERQFSVVTGKLGGDPYSLSEDETKAILAASNYLSTAVAHASALHSVIERTASADAQLKPLQAVSPGSKVMLPLEKLGIVES